jgi:hypothetical protein
VFWIEVARSLAGVAFIVLVVCCALLLLQFAVEMTWEWWSERHERRRAAVEAQLDCEAAQLRAAIYRLARELNMDARQASDALREAAEAHSERQLDGHG